MLLQVNLDMTDSMGPGKLVRHMQNPSYTYDEYLICIELGPRISSVICKDPSYSGPSYPSSPVVILVVKMLYSKMNTDILPYTIFATIITNLSSAPPTQHKFRITISPTSSEFKVLLTDIWENYSTDLPHAEQGFLTWICDLQTYTPYLNITSHGINESGKI